MDCHLSPSMFGGDRSGGVHPDSDASSDGGTSASADERDGVNTAADAQPDAGAVRKSDGKIARRRMGHRQGGTDVVRQRVPNAST